MLLDKSPKVNSPFLIGIDCLITLKQKEAKLLRGRLPAGLAVRGAELPTSEQARQLEELENSLAHLHQIKQWLLEDPKLLPLVDSSISKQVQAMERRQQRQAISLAVITTVAGALLGWLTSALASPISLWHLLVH